MSATFVESPEVKKAQSITFRVEEVSEDVQAEREQKQCSNLQSLVLDCLALAKQWVAVVSHFSTVMGCDIDLDYRKIGEILKPAAEKTRDVYADVADLITHSVCKIQATDQDDLKLAIIEAKNISEWLGTWPAHNRGRRAEARQAIGYNPVCDDPVG